MTTPLQLQSYTKRGNAQEAPPPEVLPRRLAALIYHGHMLGMVCRTKREIEAIIAHLYALGATQDEIVTAFRRDVPGLAETTYESIVAAEVMRLLRNPTLRHRLDPPEYAPDPGRLQAAELILEELRAHGAYALRKGDTVDVRRLGPATTHRLTDELKAAIGDYAEEIFELAKDAQPIAPRQAGDMSPALAAFAAGQGSVCAYCEREGDARGDPDGAAWHKDHVPSLRTANPFVLACSACRARPDRAALLEGADV